jgi:hypothetical protein
MACFLVASRVLRRVSFDSEDQHGRLVLWRVTSLVYEPPTENNGAQYSKMGSTIDVNRTLSLTRQWFASAETAESLHASIVNVNDTSS